jgi:hypothetical protein
MLKLAERLRDRLNGECAESFRDKYYGRFFTGDITVKYDAAAFTLSVHLGKVIAVQKGIPVTGVDLGVSGGAEDWKEFGDRKSLSVSLNSMNPHNLSLTGAPLRTRQNFNALAYLCRVFSEILESGGLQLIEKEA